MGIFGKIFGNQENKGRHDADTEKQDKDSATSEPMKVKAEDVDPGPGQAKYFDHSSKEPRNIMLYVIAYERFVQGETPDSVSHSVEARNHRFTNPLNVKEVALIMEEAESKANTFNSSGKNLKDQIKDSPDDNLPLNETKLTEENMTETTNNIPPAKLSQRQLIEDHLRMHGTITTIQAFNLYGITRVSEYIRVMRSEGIKIRSVKKTGQNRFGKETWWVAYTLIK